MNRLHAVTVDNTQGEEQEIPNKLNTSILHVCTNFRKLVLSSSLKRFIPAISKLQVSWVNVVNERSWMEHAMKIASELQKVKIVLFG